MSDFMGPLGAASSVLGTVGNIVSTVMTNDTNERLQREANAQNQRNFDLQRADNLNAAQITRDREDNAVQRKAHDLIEAHFSPVLAAGAGASASQPFSSGQLPSIQAPRHQAANVQGLSDTVPAALAAMKDMQQYAVSDGQLQLLRAQARNTDADTTLKLLNDPIVRQNLKNLKAQEENTKADTVNKGYTGANIQKDTELKEAQRQETTVHTRNEDAEYGSIKARAGMDQILYNAAQETGGLTLGDIHNGGWLSYSWAHILNNLFGKGGDTNGKK